MKKFFPVLLLALLAVACQPGEKAPPAAAQTPPATGFVDESGEGVPRDGGTLYRRLEEEPTTLNPILQTSDYDDFVITDLSRNLVDFDKKLNIVGGLCDRWEVSPDGKSLTFHLRDDATWEDGSPVTSEDAAFTIRQIVNPHVPAVLFSPGFDGYQKVETLDARTFRVEFAAPYAFRLAAFNFPLLPASRYEGKNILTSPLNRAPLSDGPYRLASWKTGEEITLVRNEKYRGPRPHFDRVIFRLLPDGAQSYRAILQGSIDEMRLSTDQWESARKDPAFARCCRVAMFYGLSYFYIGYNNRSPLFADAATRQAMAMLLDRASLVRDLFDGTARALSGPWPADLPAYDSSVTPWPYDPARARQLLSGAGWKPAPDGVLARAGKRFDFQLLYAGASLSSREVVEFFAADLKKAGIICRPAPMDWAAFEKRMDAGEFDAVASAWSGDTNPDLYAYWDSAQAPPAGLNNLSYSNPRADKLIEEARRELNPAARLVLYHQLHRIIHEDAPATFALQPTQKYALSKRIGGLVTTPLGLYKFWPGSVAWWDRNAPH